MKNLRCVGILALTATMTFTSCNIFNMVKLHEAIGVSGTANIKGVPETADANLVVGTLAGDGKPGIVDGPGITARFNYPAGITVDSKGHIFVADFFNTSIREIEPTGEVSIPVMTPKGSGDQYGEMFGSIGNSVFIEGVLTPVFLNPVDVAVGADGNLYLVAYEDNRIWKVIPGEKVTLDLRIQKIVTGGRVSILTGKGLSGNKDGDIAEARFKYPLGIAADAAGNIYISDTENHRIRKITPEGMVFTLAGSKRGFKDGSGTEAEFNKPVGLAVDTSGNIYVADRGNHSIRKITAEGVVSTLAGSEKGFMDGSTTEARFNKPSGVAVDSDGIVYVADQKNNIIRKITPEGQVGTLAGSGIAGFEDGNAVTAQFRNPMGVAVDLDGNVFVSDTGNQRIRMIEGVSRPRRNIVHADNADKQSTRM